MTGVELVENAAKPLNLNEHRRALLRQVVLIDEVQKEAHLLLTIVDLIPDEVPLVDVPSVPCERIAGKRKWTIRLIHEELPANEAVEMYNRLIMRAEWQPEAGFGEEMSFCCPQEFQTEPRWPYMIYSNYETATPISGQYESLLCSHAFPTQQMLIEAMDEHEQNAVTDYVRRYIGVNLKDAPEFWESAHLKQATPTLRNLKTRLHRSEEGYDVGIYVDLQLRKNGSLEKLMIELTEHRPTGMRTLARFRPRSTLCEVKVSEDVKSVEVRAYHDEYGLICVEPAVAYIRKLMVSMSLGGRPRVVPTPKRRRIKKSMITLTTYTPDQVLEIDPAPSDSEFPRVLDSYVKRKVEAESIPKDTEYAFFNNDHERAITTVRSVLESARRAVLIVDPYFTAREVVPWLSFVTHQNVAVQLLTSMQGLKQARDGGDSSDTASDDPGKAELLREIQRAKKEREINEAVSVRIMRGKRSPIHDRFLVVDEKIWLLGSSLNSFGNKGTMIVLLRNPAAVRPSLIKTWEESDLLAEEPR